MGSKEHRPDYSGASLGEESNMKNKICCPYGNLAGLSETKRVSCEVLSVIYGCDDVRP